MFYPVIHSVPFPGVASAVRWKSQAFALEVIQCLPVFIVISQVLHQGRQVSESCKQKRPLSSQGFIRLGLWDQQSRRESETGLPCDCEDLTSIPRPGANLAMVACACNPSSHIPKVRAWAAGEHRHGDKLVNMSFMSSSLSFLPFFFLFLISFIHSL